MQTARGILHIDSRPSDAIALAVRAKCPVFVDGGALDVQEVPGAVDEGGAGGSAVKAREDHVERAGLVEASTGLAKIKVGDRLVAIYDKFGNLSHKVPKVPGAYVSKAEPHFGLNGGKNLLMVTFRGRDPGATS